MTARDRFTGKISCPKCGKTGVANYSELDGWSFAKGDTSTRIDAVPEGFVKIGTGGTAKIQCVTCQVDANE